MFCLFIYSLFNDAANSLRRKFRIAAWFITIIYLLDTIHRLVFLFKNNISEAELSLSSGKSLLCGAESIKLVTVFWFVIWLLNFELEAMWKEMVVSYFEALLRHFPRESEQC
jgi:hypothetical protein